MSTTTQATTSSLLTTPGGPRALRNAAMVRPTRLVNEGEQLTLLCLSAGSPLPSFTWTRENSAALPNAAVVDPGTGTLVIGSVLPEDDGMYTCTADNGVDVVTSNVSFSVCPDISGCSDSSKWCPNWARDGQCESNPGWMLPNCPLSCGVCHPDLPHECLTTKRGRSWDTWECSNVTNVPDEVRAELNLDTFYQKYLHAYGIPILSSSLLPDDALRRCCYDVLFMLADRRDLRDSYFNVYGRAAIMAESEVTLDIPEHSNMDPSFNTRARGLGGTVTFPVSTGAEENVLCYQHDRLRVEDIFMHEFAHGVHNMAARIVIPDFNARLEAAYQDALANGRFANTYAADTVFEYWAEGVQSYFDVNHERDPPDGIHNHVNTREELMVYDPVLYNLVHEIFPCENKVVDRCENDYDESEIRVDCENGLARTKIDGSSIFQTNRDNCASVICENGGTCINDISTYTCNCASGYEGDHCETDIDDCYSVVCENGGTCIDGVNSYTCNCIPGYEGDHCETMISITTRTTPLGPTTTLSGPIGLRIAAMVRPTRLVNEGEQMTILCLSGGSPFPPRFTWTRGNSAALPASAVVDPVTGTLVIGGVRPEDDGMYTCTADNGVDMVTSDASFDVCPDVSDCSDSSRWCPNWARDGQCESNPGWMLPNCPLSCGVCHPDLPAECLTTKRGRAWETWECNNVTDVPDDVRTELSLDTFYQKYLHAYGIPILGSSILPDDALRRCCYDVLFMLADRRDLRDSYFNVYGRAAIMAESEVTLDVPEHSNMDPIFNTRARGLGGTTSFPVSTGAEENVLCYQHDSLRVEDIFMHEFAHGVHNMAAKIVIPDFNARLEAAYQDAMANGRFANTYAADTVFEYWAEGVQSYFDVNHERDPPDGIHNHVNTREELMAYDPVLYNLVHEVFPCENRVVKRCVKDYDASEIKVDCENGLARTSIDGSTIFN
ncbi:uncharacterized protein [Branchiostoma lanceolatum]|uniref:uncharacterized protein n=1 Tax=Branchiostoma lanceolatum TaxID=7740 RepID=UPI003456099C